MSEKGVMDEQQHSDTIKVSADKEEDKDYIATESIQNQTSGDNNNNAVLTSNVVDDRRSQNDEELSMESDENLDSANDSKDEAVGNGLKTAPPEVMSSFSSNRSTPNTEHVHSFFQPNPQNFFEAWPIPFHYLPANQQEKPRGFNLVKFITAGIASSLKILGVEELDCKEYVESWLSQRQQRRWAQSLKRRSVISFKQQKSESHPCVQSLQTIIDRATPGMSPSEKPDFSTIFNLSKPNSSMLRLSGNDNHDNELAHFLNKTEEVRYHINNATCTLLQAIMLMMLPYTKVISGHKMEPAGCKSFVKDWIQIIAMMGLELKPEFPKDANIMISREFGSLRDESKKLYKIFKKLHKKIQKVFDENDSSCKRALARLHPKSSASYSKEREKENSTSTFDEKMSQSETIYFAPIPLHKASINTAELFKNHVCFSWSKIGDLIYKSDIEGDWEIFSELPQVSRRELFLYVVDDLRWSLRAPLTIIDRARGVCIDGYPENICAKLCENLAYLKHAGKHADLSVLSKATIVTQVNCLHESMTRFQRTLKDAQEISKHFYKSIKSNTYAYLGTNHVQLRKTPKASANGSSNIGRLNPEGLVSLGFSISSSEVKLVVPFPISTDPIEDQFFMSSV